MSLPNLLSRFPVGRAPRPCDSITYGTFSVRTHPYCERAATASPAVCPLSADPCVHETAKFRVFGEKQRGQASRFSRWDGTGRVDRRAALLYILCTVCKDFRLNLRQSLNFVEFLNRISGFLRIMPSRSRHVTLTRPRCPSIPRGRPRLTPVRIFGNPGRLRRRRMHFSLCS